MKKIIISTFLVLFLRICINLFLDFDPHVGQFLPKFFYQIIFGFIGLCLLVYVVFFNSLFKKSLFYTFVAVVNISSLIEIFITKTNNNKFYVFIGFIFLIGVLQFTTTIKPAKFKQ